MPIRTDLARRYKASNVTPKASSTWVERWLAPDAAPVADLELDEDVFALGRPGGDRYKGCLVNFHGGDAENEIFKVNVWSLLKSADDPARVLPILMGQAVVTLGTATGDGALIPSADLIADTVVWTPQTGGHAEKMITAYGAPAVQAVSPADNVMGGLVIADAIAGDLVLEFIENGSSDVASANAVVTPIT